MTARNSEFTRAAELMQQYSNSYAEDNDLDPEECRSKARDCLESVGYTKKLQGGTYRNVYGSENTVVKLAVGRNGVKENSAEIRNNTRISGTQMEDVVDNGVCTGDKYIADIIDYEVGDNRWIVMERVSVTPNNVSQETADKIQASLSASGIHIDEIDPVNMGVLDDIPVIFDYAGT